ncbi:unnamed protein product [Prorocentrum cordatum]|uniref:Uncharacterized protein n=1 Tax=Prorocentrum cordatum TaxID=2364126 RepID=A0ABN9WJW9_9DINO|nr:unnamed protein product [Polarella glacialis]
MAAALRPLVVASLAAGASALSTVVDRLSQGMGAGLGEGAAAAEQRAALHDGANRSGHVAHRAGAHRAGARQTPEELGVYEGVSEVEDFAKGVFSESYCLDLGAKGFPIPVFKMMQLAKWNVGTYLDKLEELGFADDALQMNGPQEAMLKSNCMQEARQSRTKHIFVGDSQMMALRNALHRLNGCPEIWWHNSSRDQQELLASIRAGRRVKTGNGRFHSHTDQTPDGALPSGCNEGGIGSFIFWDAWLDSEIPVREIQREMKVLGVEPKEGDSVVVWIGSNFIAGSSRKNVLLKAIDTLHSLGVKMVWDSPTYIDDAMMAATTAKDLGTDLHTGIPITYTEIAQRKVRGEIGSNQYRRPRRPSWREWAISR